MSCNCLWADIAAVVTIFNVFRYDAVSVQDSYLSHPRLWAGALHVEPRSRVMYEHSEKFNIPKYSPKSQINHSKILLSTDELRLIPNFFRKELKILHFIYIEIAI